MLTYTVTCDAGVVFSTTSLDEAKSYLRSTSLTIALWIEVLP